MDCAALGADCGLRGACPCFGVAGAVFVVVSVLHPQMNADSMVALQRIKCVVFIPTV